MNDDLNPIEPLDPLLPPEDEVDEDEVLVPGVTPIVDDLEPSADVSLEDEAEKELEIDEEDSFDDVDNF